MTATEGEKDKPLKECEKCGEQRRTTCADRAAGGPWLCAGCFLSYKPPGEKKAADHPLGSLGQGPSEAPRGQRGRGKTLGTLPAGIGGGGGSALAALGGGSAFDAGAGAGLLSTLARGGTSASSSALPGAGSAGSSLAQNARRNSPEGRLRPTGQTDDDLLAMARPLGQGFQPVMAGMNKLKRSQTAAGPLILPDSEPRGPLPDTNYRGLLETTVGRPQTDSYKAKILSRRNMAKIIEQNGEHAIVADIDAGKGVDPRELEKQERADREKEERKRRVEGTLPAVPEGGQAKTEKRKEDAPATGSAAPDPSRCTSAENEEPLPGGFRRGEAVKSLVSRERRSSAEALTGTILRILELGMEGTIVGAVASHTCVNGREVKDHAVLLMIQFKPGFDWLLAPHQLCSLDTYAVATAAALPGGYHWGDRVRSVVEQLSNLHCSKRGILLGDSGTVIGHGQTPGKLAVRFDDMLGEWSIWPTAVCKAEGFDLALVAEIPGHLKRGDRVRAQASQGVSAASKTSTLRDGQEGVVLGPGHVSGRVLVRWDRCCRTWSMLPSQLTSDRKKERRSSKDDRDRKPKEVLGSGRRSKDPQEAGGQSLQKSSRSSRGQSKDADEQSRLVPKSKEAAARSESAPSLLLPPEEVQETTNSLGS